MLRLKTEAEPVFLEFSTARRRDDCVTLGGREPSLTVRDIEYLMACIPAVAASKKPQEGKGIDEEGD